MAVVTMIEEAGGGSGFVWTSSTRTYAPSGYSVSEEYYLTNAQTIAGNTAIPNYNGIGTKVGNAGDGYVKISFVIN